MKRIPACVLGLVCAIAIPVVARAAEEPRKRENSRFVIVESWKFVANGEARAKEIWHDTYIPAMRAAGVPLPITLHADTGEWDMVLVYPLAGGITDLEYTNISPSDAKWWAMVEKELGGADKALALGGELQTLIARKDSYLAHEHLEKAAGGDSR